MRDETNDRGRGEQGTPTGSHADRNTGAGPPAEGVLTLVCLTCGTEYHFADRDPDPAMSCEKCGGTVFRDFFSTNDEAAVDFADTTARDLDPDDAEGETLPGDVLDLNRD